MKPDEELPKFEPSQPSKSGILQEIIQNAGLSQTDYRYTSACRGMELLVSRALASEEPAVHVDEAFLLHVITEIDQKLSAQIDEILHHPAFQQMEASWTGLKFLVDHTDFRKNVELEYLSVSKDDLLTDFRKAREIAHSGLCKIVYWSEYGHFGGQPFAAIIGNYEFGPKERDIELLRNIASIAAMAHAPLIAAASAQFFRIESLVDLQNIGGLTQIMQGAEYANWNSFRDSAIARYVGLTLPRFLLRLPYSEENNPVKSFGYEEDVSRSHDQYLWGNSAFAFASRLTDSFARYGWCPNIIGLHGGGAIEDLPIHRLKIRGNIHAKGPSEVLISQGREFELAEAGFIPLTMLKHDRRACFFSANSCQRPAFANIEKSDGAQLSSALRAKLPYTFIVCRIAHYLKVRHGEQVGIARGAADIQRELQDWINQYVADFAAAPEIRAKHPLRQARIAVEDVTEDPGYYRLEIEVRPHLTYMGASVTLSLVGRLDRPGQPDSRNIEAFRDIALNSKVISEWRLTLAIQQEGLSETAIDDIVRALRRLTGDDELTLVAVESGSVILRLKGSLDGYRVLEHLFRSGHLSSVLGLPVEAIVFTETSSTEPSQPADTSSASAQHEPCHVFCSYSHRDSAFRDRLERHLRVLERSGLIHTWHDRKLTGGDDWRGKIDENLDRAHLILLLVSADFLASDYCYDVEMKRALERHKQKEARVVPILLRPASWRQTPLADLQVLPAGAKPVSLWADRDGAFNSIAEDLRGIVLQLHTN